MPVQLFENNATTTLAANLGIGVLSMTVNGGDGALFPAPTGGDWFYATLESGANLEIVQVTARTGDVFTIVRAQEGTSDQSWSIGDTVELRITQAWLDRVHTLDSLPLASIGDVVGPASAVDDRVVFFDGTTGKLVKDSGLTLSGSNTGDQTLSDATITTTDITTNDFSTSKHGFTPKGTNVGKYLKDDGTWALIEDTSMHDPIINGNFDVWQREETFTALASGTYSADRWRYDHTTGGSVDITKVTLGDTAIHTATGQLIQQGLRLDVNTIDASIAAADFVLLSQFIEGYRALPYMHREFTVSFYVRSNITGTFTFSMRNNPSTNRSFLKTFTIDAANTWERKEITVPVQDRTGSWSYDENAGFLMGICLMAGTTFESTDNQWNSGNFLSVSGATNWMATATNNFDITGVQMDLGPNAHPLRGRGLQDELHLCERYFQKSYELGTFPGALTVTNSVAQVANGAASIYQLNFRQKMRVAPTTTYYSYTDGASGVWRNFTLGANLTANDNSLGDAGSSLSFTSAAPSDLDQLIGHYTLDAEL
jgi:hypothetical protein